MSDIDYIKIIDEKFYKNDKEHLTFCGTIGDMKKLLNELPDELPIEVGFGSGCMVRVYNIKTEPIVDFDEVY